jgi:hypothetical protein
MAVNLVPNAKELAKEIKDSIALAMESIKNDPLLAAKSAIDDLNSRLNEMMKDGIINGISDAFASGFDRAFNGGGAVGFIEGFGQAILRAIGNVMEQMGAALISYGVAMEIVALGLTNPFTSGPAAIAAGTLLVGLGAALNAAVNGHGGGHVGGGSYSSGSGLGSIIDRGVINPDSYSRTSAASIQQRPQVNANFTIIGPNDPNAVRGIDEILRRINQRGSLAGSAA